MPMSFAIVKDHCKLELKGKKVHLINGKGETHVNGKELKSGEKIELKPYDRVVMASELMRFHFPGQDPKGDPPTADEAAQEFREAIRKKNAGQQKAFQDQLQALRLKRLNLRENELEQVAPHPRQAHKMPSN